MLAQHLAEKHFGKGPVRDPLKPDEVVPFMLRELSHGPELWHQRSYLARVVALDPALGLVDSGVQPLTHFLDSGGPDAVAVTIEVNGDGRNYPMVYTRKDSVLAEHIIEGAQLLDFQTAACERELEAVVKEALGVPAGAR